MKIRIDLDHKKPRTKEIENASLIKYVAEVKLTSLLSLIIYKFIVMLSQISRGIQKGALRNGPVTTKVDFLPPRRGSISFSELLLSLYSHHTVFLFIRRLSRLEQADALATKLTKVIRLKL